MARLERGHPSRRRSVAARPHGESTTIVLVGSIQACTLAADPCSASIIWATGRGCENASRMRSACRAALMRFPAAAIVMGVPNSMCTTRSGAHCMTVCTSSVGRSATRRLLQPERTHNDEALTDLTPDVHARGDQRRHGASVVQCDGGHGGRQASPRRWVRVPAGEHSTMTAITR